jgi:outer membrane protein TolC
MRVDARDLIELAKANGFESVTEAITIAKKSRAEIERLRAALEPFQRNVESLSLSGALGHIGREELLNARRAYTKATSSIAAPPPHKVERA